MADDPAVNGPSDSLPNKKRPSKLEVGQATSVGRVRSGNEDSVLCEAVDAPRVLDRGLFCAVADGMGGHAAGEVASSMAVQKARDVYYDADIETVDVALRSAIETANSQVFAAGSGATGREHMGSTMTAVVVIGDRAVIGQVGDSRCYLIQDGQIRQLTRDHSWVAEEVEAGVLTPEEARVHPRRNIITRALGLRPEVEVDMYQTSVRPGSVLVLCSDGLHGPVADEEILSYTLSLPPQQAVDALIDLANERGGPDNISAIIIKVGAGADEADTIPGLPVQDVGTVADDVTPPAGIPVIERDQAVERDQAIERDPPPTDPALPSVTEAQSDTARLDAVPAPPTTREPSDPEPIATAPSEAGTPATGPGPDPSIGSPDDTATTPTAPITPITPTTPTTPTEPRSGAATARPASRRRRLSGGMLVALLLALLLLGAGLGWALYQRLLTPGADGPGAAAPRSVVHLLTPRDDGLDLAGTSALALADGPRRPISADRLR